MAKGPAFGKGKGKPGKVKTSGAQNYSGKSGIKQEVPTKKPTRGKQSK